MVTPFPCCVTCVNFLTKSVEWFLSLYGTHRYLHCLLFKQMWNQFNFQQRHMPEQRQKRGRLALRTEPTAMREKGSSNAPRGGGCLYRCPFVGRTAASRTSHPPRCPTPRTLSLDRLLTYTYSPTKVEDALSKYLLCKISRTQWQKKVDKLILLRRRHLFSK